MSEPVGGLKVLTPRQMMLAERATDQRARVSGFTPMHRKPRGFVGKDWDPAGTKRYPHERMIPASENRLTGELHAHNRARARRLRQTKASTP